MIGKRIGIFVGIFVLLTGCIISDTAASAKEDQSLLTRQSIQVLEKTETMEMPETEQEEKTVDQPSASSEVLELTEEEKISIQILVTAAYRYRASMEDYLTNQRMLECNNKESDLWMQTGFILTVYDDAYANEAKKRLEQVAEFIDEEGMLLSSEQLYILLEMAGVKPSKELEAYDDLAQHFENGYYRISKYRNGGEQWSELDFESIEKEADGSVIVEAVSRREPDYGAIARHRIKLVPNDKSIFQYSVESSSSELIQPKEVGKIGKDTLRETPYERPQSMTNHPFDYIFELEGVLYQMPFPLSELKAYGWSVEEQGTLEAGQRSTLHASKEGKTLTLGIWNYNTYNTNFTDCQVVWLKTGRDKEWNAVNFQMPEGVYSGQTRSDVEPLYHDYEKYYTTYGRRDALYQNMYGYNLHFEDEVITGFEMGYAPVPWERQKRVELMTGGWEWDEKTELTEGEDFAMEWDHIYQIDIDGDGIKEEVSLKWLKGIKWADFSCLFINGQMNYVIEGPASHQVGLHERKIVWEDGQCYFVCAGDDYANEFRRKVRLEKGWSKNVEYQSVQ